MAWQKYPKPGVCDLCGGDRNVEMIEPMGKDPIQNVLYHAKHLCEPCGPHFIKSITRGGVESIKVGNYIKKINKNIA